MRMTITAVDKRLFDTLPTPLALAWNKVNRFTGPHAIIAQCRSCFETFLRYTSAVVLQSYFQENRSVDSVEKVIRENLTRPSLGLYLLLIREVLRDIPKEEHFLSHLHNWFFDAKGKQTDAVQQIVELLGWLNHLSHGEVPLESELVHEVPKMVEILRNLFYESKWLAGYRLFVRESIVSQRDNNEGSILFLTGITDVKHEFLRWGQFTRFLQDTVYLSHPDGMQFLEMSPLLQFRDGTTQRTYLWSKVSKKSVIYTCSGQEPLTYWPFESDWSTWQRSNDKKIQLASNESRFVHEFKSKEFYEIGQFLEGAGNQYRILGRLGEGAMSIVYHVLDTVHNVERACKVLRLTRVDEHTKRRAIREYQLLRSVDHPNIVKVHNCQEFADSRVAIEMDLLDGSLDTFDFSDNNREVLLEWAPKLLSALNCLHQNGILHRDVKPANVLFRSSDNEIFLTDFGISKQEGQTSYTSTGGDLGTKQYMDPKLLSGEIPHSEATDRYALGVTLHELYTGKIPQKPGKGIEGEFGQFIRDLTHNKHEIRLAASFGPDNLSLGSETAGTITEDSESVVDTFQPTKGFFERLTDRVCEELGLQSNDEILETIQFESTPLLQNWSGDVDFHLQIDDLYFDTQTNSDVSCSISFTPEDIEYLLFPFDYYSKELQRGAIERWVHDFVKSEHQLDITGVYLQRMRANVEQAVNDFDKETLKLTISRLGYVQKGNQTEMVSFIREFDKFDVFDMLCHDYGPPPLLNRWRNLVTQCCQQWLFDKLKPMLLWYPNDIRNKAVRAKSILEGFIDTQDVIKGLTELQACAEQGDPYAQMWYAEFVYRFSFGFSDPTVHNWTPDFLSGRITRKSRELDLLDRSWIFMGGENKISDVDRRWEWFRSAADAGLPMAQWLLAEYGRHPYHQLDVTDEESAKSLKLAFGALSQFVNDVGGVEARFYLAKAYEHGLGTQLNMETALEIYRELRDLGHRGAHVNLGLLLSQSEDVAQHSEGLHILATTKESISFGVADARQVFLRGVGLEIIGQGDTTVSEMIYQNLTNKDYPPALEELARLRWQSNDESEAIELLNRALALNHHQALIPLMRIYKSLKMTSEATNELFIWCSKVNFADNPHLKEIRDSALVILAGDVRTTDSTPTFEQFCLTVRGMEISDMVMYFAEQYISDPIEKGLFMMTSTMFTHWANYIAGTFLTQQGQSPYKTGQVKTVLEVLLGEKYDQDGTKMSGLLIADLAYTSNHHKGYPCLKKSGFGQYEFLGYVEAMRLAKMS